SPAERALVGARPSRSSSSFLSTQRQHSVRVAWQLHAVQSSFDTSSDTTSKRPVTARKFHFDFQSRWAPAPALRGRRGSRAASSKALETLPGESVCIRRRSVFLPAPPVQR